jgi:SsrA-binding protein
MKITNRKAYFDYELLDRIEAGINLSGAEVKAVRLGKVDLTGSFVKITGTEAYLVNAKIYPYEYARPDGYDQKRTRKLLMHKREIMGLKSKTEATNLTIVPVSMYTTHHLIKVELAVSRPKKLFQKKEKLKRRDIDRDTETLLKKRL